MEQTYCRHGSKSSATSMLIGPKAASPETMNSEVRQNVAESVVKVSLHGIVRFVVPKQRHDFC
jgi:hypothetical protein